LVGDGVSKKAESMSKSLGEHNDWGVDGWCSGWLSAGRKVKERVINPAFFRFGTRGVPVTANANDGG
jgi:hypothetical protein